MRYKKCIFSNSALQLALFKKFVICCLKINIMPLKNKNQEI